MVYSNCLGNLQKVCAIAVFAVIAFAALEAGAVQSPPEVSELTLAQAVNYALEYNDDIKSSKENLLSAESNLRIAQTLTSAEAVGRTAIDKPAGRSFEETTQATGEFTAFTRSGSSATISASPLGLGGASPFIGVNVRKPLRRGSGPLSPVGNAILRAQYGLEINLGQFTAAKQSLILQIVNAYYNTLRAQEQIKVQEQAMSIAEETTDFAKRRLAEGLVAEIEVLRAENRLAQTRDDLIRQEQRFKDAMDGLVLVMGLSAGLQPKLVTSIPATIPATLLEEAAIDKALGNRVELSVLKSQIADQRRVTEVAEDQIKSRLDLVGSYFSWTRTSALGASIFEEPSLAVGAEYRIPLDKRTLREERDTARRQVVVLEETQRVERERIKDEIRISYRAVEAAKSSLDIYGRNLSVAEYNLKLAQQMVDEGLAVNREVLEAQDSLTRTQSGLLSAQTNYYLAWIALNWAMGDDIMKAVSE